MGHRQIIPLVFAAAVHSHIHQLPHHLMPSPDLGHRLQLSVRCKGDDGLDLEHGAGHSRDLADPAALHQILQRIHRKEGIGVGDELRSPALRQFFPVHAVFDVLSQLQHRHALTQSAADRVKHLHGIALLRTFSRQDPGQIIGPGQAAGQHDGDHAVISQIKDLPELRALQIGRATAAELTSLDGHRPRILIGKDTRVSGDMLECTLAAGLCSVGADVDLLGVIPTPGVAYLVRKYGADAGIVISASHNPMEFNGIKIFKGDGYKLPDEVENRIEAHIFKNCEDIKICDGAEIGRVHRLDTAVDDYVDALEQHIDADLSGLNVLFDCANGASAKVAQKLFPRLGCQCSFTGTLDDGVSVNDGCGSTHLDRLEKKVVEGGFDCGIAFDGDADRCLACDEKGAEIDGDKIIALVAKDMKDRGRLDGNTAVVTVMSNLGFMKYMQSIGIDTARTAVGDRYVLEEMRARGYAIGGEQSGHVIFLHHSTTGDGELTAGKLLKLLARKHREEGTKMSELNAVYTKFPQVLINLTADKEQKQAYKEDEYIAGFIESQQQNLMGMGRVLVRVSGTEPKIRVMVEGEDMEAIQSSAERIADMIRQRIPGVC